MAYYNKFSLRYKKELDKIEKNLTEEEKELYDQIFDYDEKSFDSMVGEKGKRKLENEIQKIIDSDTNRVEEYKKNMIYNYFRKELYEHLSWMEPIGEEKSELYWIIFNFALDDSTQEYPVIFEKMINSFSEELPETNCSEDKEKSKQEDMKIIQYVTNILQSQFEDGKYKESIIKELYSHFWGKLKQFKEKDIWIMRKSIHEAPIKDSNLIQGVSYYGIELLERKACNKLVELWIQFAEKECKKSEIRKKKILLCCAKDIKNLKERFLKEVKDKIKNWRISNIIDFYYDFLCKDIFPDIKFWKLVLNNKMIKQRYYDNRLHEMIRENLSVEGESVWNNDCRKKIEKQMLLNNTDNELLYEINWGCPQNKKELFKFNFDRYSFRRCFGNLYATYFGGEDGVKVF